MNISVVDELDVDGKRVLLSLDLDIKLGDDKPSLRLESSMQTLEYLIKHNAKIVAIGKRGRPGGKEDPTLSTKPVAEKIKAMLIERLGEEVMKDANLEVLENLQFDVREKANDEEFARELAKKGDVYVNESFAVSHREKASIVSVPRFFKSKGIGFRFAEEIKNLSKALNDPKKPVVLLLSGVKKDKLNYLEDFKKVTDKILVGGRLPEYLNTDQVSVRFEGDDKVVIGELIQDKEDITMHTIERFEKEVGIAGTIIVSGPLGRFEEEGHRQGTKRVFEAVVDNKDAFKLAGGGDTEEAIDLLGLSDKFNWISVGGGAMLEFLTKGTLPGIEALRE